MVHQHATGSEAAVRLGEKADFVDIRAEGDVLIIDLVGAPSGNQLCTGLQKGYERGWIRLRMQTLIDVTAFQGTIDWSAVKAIAKMANWGGRNQAPRRVAYVSADPFFVFVIKAINVIFPRTTHCLFSDRSAALGWLRGTHH